MNFECKERKNTYRGAVSVELGVTIGLSSGLARQKNGRAKSSNWPLAALTDCAGGVAYQLRAMRRGEEPRDLIAFSWWICLCGRPDIEGAAATTISLTRIVLSCSISDGRLLPNCKEASRRCRSLPDDRHRRCEPIASGAPKKKRKKQRWPDHIGPLQWPSSPRLFRPLEFGYQSGNSCRPTTTVDDNWNPGLGTNGARGKKSRPIFPCGDQWSA